jgi:hypothetical protein
MRVKDIIKNLKEFEAPTGLGVKVVQPKHTMLSRSMREVELLLMVFEVRRFEVSCTKSRNAAAILGINLGEGFVMPKR